MATSPTWLTATMSNNLISIALVADVPMAGAAAGTSVSCSSLLSSDVMEALGASPTCTWTSNRVLTVCAAVALFMACCVCFNGD